MSRLLTSTNRNRSTIVVILTLIALCFSVGEGLRLTPFPVTQGLQADSTLDNASHVTAGPLDVPTQSQSRNKRTTFAVIAATTERSELLSNAAISADPGSITIKSSLHLRLTSDRAPPFTS